MSGPYIVTTKHEGRYPGALHPQSRRAVATLEEAREAANDAVGSRMPEHRADVGDYIDAMADADNLPEAGGTVGPLPDGTVIEVSALTWIDLWAASGIGAEGLWHGTEERRQQIIDAFNQAHG